MVACLFLSGHAQAQTNNADSLRNVINSDVHDSIRAEAMADLVWLIKFTESDEALRLSREAINLSRKIGNKRVESYASNNLGIVFWGLSQYDSAINYLNIARAYYESIDDKRSRAVIMVNIALLYQNIPDYPKSLETAYGALRVFESTQDTLYASSVLLNIGNVHFLMEEYEQALENYRKSWRWRQLFDSPGFGENRQRVTLNLGNTFYKLGELDSAKYYLELSQTFAKTVPDYKNLALSNLDLGKIYSAQGEQSRALSFFRAANFIYSTNKHKNPYDQSGLYNEMSLLFRQMGNLDSAQFYARESLEIANSLENPALQKDALLNLSELGKARGNYRQAYDMLYSSISVSDSLLSAEKFELTNELETRYETEKKEQQIALQEATLGEQDARLQRNQLLITALIVMALLLIVVLVLLRARSQKEKALIKREAELQLREAEIIAVINSQEKERNRFARDLHDGFGQMISVLKMNLGQLKDLNNRDLEKREKVFSKGEQVISEMYGELRNICFDLMPQTLVKNGLGAALNEFGDRIKQSTSTHCEVLVFDLEERLPELVEISLFRIAQEWVNNVLKYAEADSITLQLTRDDAELTLTVEDDGNGFDPDVFYNGAGNGWRNIQTRLKQINGNFDLDSRKGIKGSLMTVNIDLTSVEIPTSTEAKIRA